MLCKIWEVLWATITTITTVVTFFDTASEACWRERRSLKKHSFAQAGLALRRRRRMPISLPSRRWQTESLPRWPSLRPYQQQRGDLRSGSRRPGCGCPLETFRGRRPPRADQEGSHGEARTLPGEQPLSLGSYAGRYDI